MGVFVCFIVWLKVKDVLIFGFFFNCLKLVMWEKENCYNFEIFCCFVILVSILVYFYNMCFFYRFLIECSCWIGNYYYLCSWLYKCVKDLVIFKFVGGFEIFKLGKEGNEFFSVIVGFIVFVIIFFKDVKVE